MFKLFVQPVLRQIITYFSTLHVCVSRLFSPSCGFISQHTRLPKSHAYLIFSIANQHAYTTRMLSQHLNSIISPRGKTIREINDVSLLIHSPFLFFWVLFFFLFSDALRSEIWSSPNQIQHPHLHFLAQSLPQVVIAAHAPNTVQKYSGYWLRWKRWERRYFGTNDFPVLPFRLALYLVDLRNDAASISAINGVVYAVRWAHEIADLPSPTSSAFVKSTWDGCKRLLARPVRPKDPLEVGVLYKLAADLKKPTLPDLRLLVLCLLCYSGILRIEEVLNIHVSDIVFSESAMRLRIPKRKNDQYRDGHQLNIAKTGTSVCPVTATRRLICEAGLRPDSHLICRMVYRKRGHTAHHSGISYSRARDILRNGLRQYLGEKFNFGTHSLRAGGATHASNSATVTDAALDKHAGWKSSKSKYRYIKDSEETSLIVSRNLGL